MNIRKNPRRLARFQNLLEDLGIDTKLDGSRLDAGEAAFIAKQLEYVMTEVYRTEFPELKALALIPVNTSVPSGAESFSYLMWTAIGKAGFVSNYAKDFPDTADTSVARFNFPIHSIGNGYSYSIQDIRAAQAVQFGVGTNLESERALNAREAHAQFVDQIAAFGDTARGLAGFVNHSQIPDVTVSSGGGAWSTTLATISDANNAIIVNDLNKLVAAPEQATLGLRAPDTLALPLSVKPRLMAATSTYVRQSLLANWLQNQEQIKEVVFWAKLDAANSDGKLTTGVARAIAYKKDPKNLDLVIPQPFEMFPPQQTNMAFFVPCHSRIGGVCIKYPLGFGRMNVGA